jgi:hypothetical protein
MRYGHEEKPMSGLGNRPSFYSFPKVYIISLRPLDE